MAVLYDDPVDISAEMWGELIRDREVTREKDLEVLKIVYESNSHTTSGGLVAKQLGMPDHRPLNPRIGGYGKRVVERTGVTPPGRSNKPYWWMVPFTGFVGERDWWIMRPELVAAFDDLYGGPTGEISQGEEIPVADPSPTTEGGKTQVLVNRYERSRAARSKCIAHHGCVCLICGFNFGKTYGPIGRGKIHVHHIQPLSEIGSEYVVDPVKDMFPVCANCHFIIHSITPPLSMTEVRKMMAAHAQQITNAT